VSAFTYETAVHAEDVERLTDELLAVIAEATEDIPEDHIRNAITVASLLTAAQRLDELPLPVLWKRGGITGMIRHMAAKWL
jgi:hypothetical protein